jgi:kynurenine formamidase
MMRSHWELGLAALGMTLALGCAAAQPVCPPALPPVAATAAPPATAAAPPVDQAPWLAPFEVVDLTHVLHDDMVFWPGGVPFKKTRLVDYDQGYRLHKLEVGENTGTHVDAPAHFVAGGPTIDQIPVRDLVVDAVVIDVRAPVKGDPDYLVSAADVRAWEAQHGTIAKGVLVIANTGFHQRFGDPASYIGLDAQKVMHFPGYHPDAAKLLLERGVAGIGIDTLSLDHGPSQDFPTHKVMLPAGKYMIENLANLDALPPKGAKVIIGVLPIREGTQAQARILALLPGK